MSLSPEGEGGRLAPRSKEEGVNWEVFGWQIVLIFTLSFLSCDVVLHFEMSVEIQVEKSTQFRTRACLGCKDRNVVCNPLQCIKVVKEKYNNKYSNI